MKRTPTHSRNKKTKNFKKSQQKMNQIQPLQKRSIPLSDSFIPTKTRKIENGFPCPSDMYTTKELSKLEKYCLDPSKRRKLLADLSPDRNSGCRSKALDKFQLFLDICNTQHSTPTPVLQITNFLSSYWNDTKTRFDAFYNENKNKKCTMLDHKLRPSLYLKYRNALTEEIEHIKKGFEIKPMSDEYKYIKILEYYRNVYYVSYVDFLASLEETAKNVRDRIIKVRKENPDTIAILRVAYPIHKSALWVTMLIYPILRDVIHGVEINQKINPAPYKELRKKQISKIILIYPDDCIYSGQQFTRTLSTDSKSLKDYTKNITCFPLCPFVTDRFLDLIKEKTYWKEHFPHLDQPIYIDFNENKTHIIQTLSYDMVINTFWFKRKGLVPFVSPYLPTNFYFQHKLADELSTITRILSYGAIPIKGEVEFIGNLIDNCTTLQGGFGHSDFQSEEDRCPPSCYKKINYTWNGKLIPKNAFLGDVIKH